METIIVGIFLKVSGALITGAILVMAWSIRSMLAEIKMVNKSINELNQKVGVTIERQDWHQRELDRLEGRINAMED